MSVISECDYVCESQYCIPVLQIMPFFICFSAIYHVARNATKNTVMSLQYAYTHHICYFIKPSMFEWVVGSTVYEVHVCSCTKGNLLFCNFFSMVCLMAVYDSSCQGETHLQIRCLFPCMNQWGKHSAVLFNKLQCLWWKLRYVVLQ